MECEEVGAYGWMDHDRVAVVMLVDLGLGV